MNIKDIADIRGHHLLCMRYFQGKGYSEEFIINFSRVLEALKDDPEIKVVNHPDAICMACPHLLNDRCNKNGPGSEKDIIKMDDLVLQILELTPGRSIDIQKVRRMIGARLPVLKEICRDCEWDEYCVEVG